MNCFSAHCCRKSSASTETSHTWRTHAYKGIGRIPRDLRGKTDPSKRILLDRLPRILAGYGKSLQGSDSAVVVVVDLDDRDCVGFKQELLQILEAMPPEAPSVLFRFAIEEMEAWLLGDRKAILKAFPRAKMHVLRFVRPGLDMRYMGDAWPTRCSRVVRTL